MKEPDGRQALYNSWVRDYSQDLYRCALRLCGQPHVAEELVQEVFYEAWRSMDTLRDQAKARVWLLSILRHRYMHWLRDQKRHPKSGPAAQEQAQRLSTGDDLPQDILARQESLQAALDALEDRYKVPFLLVFLEGMTCQRAAEFLDIPLGTVLSRIHRARHFLRDHLEREQTEPRHMRLHRSEEPDEDEPRTGAGGVK